MNSSVRSKEVSYESQSHHDDGGIGFLVGGAAMTLHEAIEGLAKVRERMYQDAARLTIELEAYQDVLNQTTRTETYDHAWERGVYADAYSQAVDMLKLERGEL